MNKKFLIGLVVVAVAAAAFFALSSKKEQEQTAAGLKDTITFCQGNDLTTMDASIGQQERAYTLTNHIFDPLFTHDADMKVIPCLALSNKWLDDKTLEITLREGVKFQDGSTMTPEDVKFTMDLINKRGALFVGNYESCTVDGSKVIIKLKKPNPALVSILTLPQASILPQKIYEKDPDGFAKKPVGTGPYKLKDFAEGDYYTLERFDDYWGTPAKTKYLTMKIVPEPAQRTILLETGKVDAAYDIPGNDIKRVQENNDLQILTGDSMKIILMEMNTQSKGPLGKAKVRKAIECAIDKKNIVDSLLYGYGNVSSNIVPASAQDYMDYQSNTFNLEQAKKLLAEAGYPNGFTTSIWTNSNQTNTEISQVLQSQLSKVGIKLNIVVQDDNTSFTRIEGGQDFDMILDFWQTNTGHADYVFNGMLLSTSVNNFARYKNPKFDEVYKEYASTGEGEKRQELLKQLYGFLTTDVPIIGLYSEKKVVAATKALEGVKISQIGAHEYQDAVLHQR